MRAGVGIDLRAAEGRQGMPLATRRDGAKSGDAGWSGARRAAPRARVRKARRNIVAGTEQMAAQMAGKGGFIAALDQSGGSTPGALRQYGVPDDAYHGDAEMFQLIHEMRVRIITSPAFTGERVIGSILLEGTMDGTVKGKPTPSYLWQDRGVVPFVKVDKGLEADADS